MPQKTPSSPSLQSIPAIDIRACVLSKREGSLFAEISDRICALATACAAAIGLTQDSAEPQWDKVAAEGVEIKINTESDHNLFVPWGAVENEASMAAYLGWVTASCKTPAF